MQEVLKGGEVEIASESKRAGSVSMPNPLGRLAPEIYITQIELVRCVGVWLTLRSGLVACWTANSTFRTQIPVI